MRKIFFYLPLVWLCVSCIQDEPLNAEADIEECVFVNAKTGEQDLHVRGNVLVTNTKVIAQANPSIELAELALKVKLTEGATISPDPEQQRDFSRPQRFEVTSQDGKWKKVYTVSVDTFEMPTVYDFEHYMLDETKRFHTFYEEVQGSDTTFNQYIWASGNSGYALTGVGRNPEDYPTVSVVNKQGKRAVKLETKSTGDFGALAKMPIAAGNLFIGSFDVRNAMEKAREATLFGLPFGKKPISLMGLYKFKRGEVFTVVDKFGKPVVVSGRKDACDIYAVLYESAGLEKNSLNGDNVLNSDHIVAMARVKNPTVHEPGADMSEVEYEMFKVDFDYASFQAVRPFSMEKLKNYEYNLAVVFTSSVQGAYFEGAVGSTLYVDQVRVICE